jgi:hypothetical protein
MTEQQVQRASAKRKKYALLDQWFDDQPEQEAIAHHLNRRYP